MADIRRNSDMMLTVVAFASLCGVAASSGFHPVAPIGHAPVVTATSSQYFERTFNRLVAPPQLVPIAPEPPVYVEPAHALPVPVPPPQAFPIHPVSALPVQPIQPTQPVQPVEPNVATAVAIANAAAPVATILLPPYPFGPPPTFGLIPQAQPNNRDETTKEPTTTTQSTTQVEVKTTREPESTTPLSRGNGAAFAGSSSDNSFSQALPANENVNFKQYLAPAPPRPEHNQHVAQPQPQPLPHHHHHHHHHHHPHGHIHLHPQKLRTSVEIVKVPLAYISPPPLPHFHHNHEAVKVVKHVHTFVPARTKLIIRPVSSKSHNVPAKFYGPPLAKKISLRHSLPLKKEAEATTFRPFYRSNLRPPKV